MKKLTEWFPAHIDPVRIGIYEVQREYTDGSQMAPHRLRWTGSAWEYCSRIFLARNGDYASMTGGDYWRGLTRPPK